MNKQIKNSPNHYEVLSRNFVEQLVKDFINRNQIVAYEGKHNKGVFEVHFSVKEEGQQWKNTHQILLLHFQLII